MFLLPVGEADIPGCPSAMKSLSSEGISSHTGPGSLYWFILLNRKM